MYGDSPTRTATAGVAPAASLFSHTVFVGRSSAGSCSVAAVDGGGVVPAGSGTAVAGATVVRTLDAVVGSVGAAVDAVAVAAGALVAANPKLRVVEIARSLRVALGPASGGLPGPGTIIHTTARPSTHPMAPLVISNPRPTPVDFSLRTQAS